MSANFSLTSRLLDGLGRTLLAPMPKDAPDFYWRPEDRRIVDVTDEVLEQRLAFNQLRIRLFEWAAWVSTGVAFTLCLLGMVVLITLHGVGAVVHGVSQTIERGSVETDVASGDCAQVAARYAQRDLVKEGLLKPEQFVAFRNRCAATLQQKP